MGLDCCYRCGGPIERVEELSIDHKEAWMGASDPVQSFWDLENIAFSHSSCNSAAAMRPHKKYFTDAAKREAKSAENKRQFLKNPPEIRRLRRRERYLRTGN